LTRRRLVFILLTGGLAVLGVFIWLSPFPGLALRTLLEERIPARISWEGKTAWRRCDSAIAGETSWPSSPQAACAAMELCANEAPLSDDQRRRLAQLTRDTPGCQPP